VEGLVSTLMLPRLLAEAGCTVAVVKRHVVVLDRDGAELARGPRLQAAWLWTASTAALIERCAEALGFRHELHPEELRFRLWRPGLRRAAAPWQDFAEALAWLARIERAIAQPKRLRFHLVRAESITRHSRPRQSPPTVLACGPGGRAPPGCPARPVGQPDQA
jgi:hypothetical protein